MNRLGVARQALVDAVAPVLPGRTWPYPPSPQQAGVAPAVWIGEHRGFRTTIGERIEIKLVQFPIWVVYDGADRAQVAGLDDILSGVLDAVAHVQGAEVSGWNPAPLLDLNTSRRAVVVDVEYPITSTTFCLPAVGGDVIEGPDDVVEGVDDVIFGGLTPASIPPDLIPNP